MPAGIPKAPESLRLPIREEVEVEFFLKLFVNRFAVGNLRYGRPNRRKQYLTRLRKELRAYGKTGNMEQLLNVAVYAMLESMCPQHRAFHFDNSVDSVTRK